MRLVHPHLNTPLEWDTPQTIVLVVEQPTQLYRWVSQLYDQSKGAEGDWVATHNGKELKWNKEVLCWTQFCDMADTERRLHAKLVERLVSLAFDQTMYLETHQALAAVQQYLHHLLDSADSNLVLDTLDLGALLKAANLQWEPTDSLLCRLAQYFDALATLTPVRLVVTVGLYHYLPREDIAKLWYHCATRDIAVLAIEATQPPRIADEKILVVDQDLCEFFIQ